MSDKFDDLVTNWRLRIPLMLTATGLAIAIKFGSEYSLASGKLVRMKGQRLEALRAESRREEASVQLAWMKMAAVHVKEREVNRFTTQKRALEARLRAAELQWSRTHVLSPLDGSVILKRTELINAIGPHPRTSRCRVPRSHGGLDKGVVDVHINDYTSSMSSSRYYGEAL